MTVDFAAVLHAPDNSAHYGEENPTFKIEVEVTDPTTGDKATLPCGVFTVSVSENASILIKNKSHAQCSSSIANDADEYRYLPWTSTSYDLSNYIGYEVTLNVINHDCLVRACNTICAGGHESYGYFRAETRKLQLIPDVCGNKNYATITAPRGFVSYTWSRSDGRPVELLDPNDPTVAKIPVAYLIKDVVYTCVVRDATGCSQVSLTTKADPITINPNFTYTNDCSGLVHFTNTSTIVG
ncbi:MAG: hypothetical protein J5808_06600, partial [Paludibacteraceae bacterium]|nr:hypothetical protein [Paludibacteraceae bacterium]